MAYNVSPSPVSGSGAYGQVPGQVQAPPSVWSQEQDIPGFSNLTSSAVGDIQSELNGQLSPSTMMAINNQAASRGVSLGDPNSPLSNLIGLNITGNTAENLQSQGLGAYNTFTGTTGSQQQSPSLLANIAESNAVNAAAPNPETAAQTALSLYQQYMNPTGGKSSFSYNPSGGGVSYSQFPSQSGTENFQGEGQSTDPYSVYSYGGSGPDIWSYTPQNY